MLTLINSVEQKFGPLIANLDKVIPTMLGNRDTNIYLDLTK